MSEDKKYINGVYIQMFDGKYGDFISIGITEEGLKELAALPKNDKGVRNFAAFRRKSDNRKFNPMWPKEGQAPSKSKDDYLPPREEDVPPVTSSDLPF